jgi:hypothetical protein
MSCVSCMYGCHVSCVMLRPFIKMSSVRYLQVYRRFMSYTIYPLPPFVICHMLYAIRAIHHTPYVIRQTPYVTRHTSYAIRHTSYVIRHTPYVIRYALSFLRRNLAFASHKWLFIFSYTTNCIAVIAETISALCGRPARQPDTPSSLTNNSASPAV